MRNRWITYDANQKRLWVASQRLHHGAFGVVTAIIGVALILHDRRDYRDWFKGGLQHAPKQDE